MNLILICMLEIDLDLGNLVIIFHLSVLGLGRNPGDETPIGGKNTYNTYQS